MTSTVTVCCAIDLLFWPYLAVLHKNLAPHMNRCAACGGANLLQKNVVKVNLQVGKMCRV